MQSFYLWGAGRRVEGVREGGITSEEQEMSGPGGVSFRTRVEVTNDGFCERARDRRHQTRECRD